MKLSPLIAPIAGIVVSTSASIAFDEIAKQLAPSDLKAIPTFGLKIGVAIIGGLLAGKIALIVQENIESVVQTVQHDEGEDVTPEQGEN